jgi:acyl-CoA synthetase (AMP-forming)/AMP-acid ligase II
MAPPPDLNLAALLMEHPCADGELLLHEVDRSMTAGEARRLATAVAAELGDVAGRPVAVKLPDGIELVATMVGVWLAGGVHVPVNARHPEAEVTHVLAASDPAVLIDETGIHRLGARSRSSTRTRATSS